MISSGILFFADRLPPLIGGMEMHAGYFIDYFANHARFPLAGIITKNREGQDCLVINGNLKSIDITKLADMFNPTLVFFNSGRWIEELEQIRNMFPKAFFFYRTGGNEILKAPLFHKQISDHSLWQAYWVENLNNSIDQLITNSAFTEKRLQEIGITCPFIRCVGGVNTLALKSPEIANTTPLIIFCAARFVPYKNHTLLISIIHELVMRGHDLRLRLAGDGPLLFAIKDQVAKTGLNQFVEFLGAIDNMSTCQEIARANIYMQVSMDYVTEVPGGSYIHSEGMGRSILEALTAGTFIIAGRSGALPEIVTEDRGLLIKLDKIEQSVTEIENIIKYPPVKQKKIDDFSWANIFNCYEELFAGINENIVNYRKM